MPWLLAALAVVIVVIVGAAFFRWHWTAVYSAGREAQHGGN